MEGSTLQRLVIDCVCVLTVQQRQRGSVLVTTKLETEMEKQQAQQKHSSRIVASSELVLQLLFALGLHFNRTSDFAIHAPDHPRARE